MPRQTGRSSAPARRPAVAPPTRPTAPTPQSRPMTTSAQPPAQTQASQAPAMPVQQSQRPGLFGQMASTAAGVAVGSSIGHAIGGFFGGSSSAPVEQPAQTAQTSTYEAPKVCQNEVFSFRKCMDDNQGDLNVCGWYLDQLKACQASASHY